jgi:hypothetical protein
MEVVSFSFLSRRIIPVYANILAGFHSYPTMIKN